MKGYKILGNVERQTKIKDVGAVPVEKYLDSIVEAVDELGLKAIYMTPYSNRIADNDYMTLEKYFNDKHLEYVCMNKCPLNIDYKTDFYDAWHLNSLGAIKATEFMGNYLSENYVFKNK